jgi:transposase-like protein
MTRKRHSPAQIARKLNEIHTDLAGGASHEETAARAGISEQTLRRWLRDYSEQADNVSVRLKRLQGENQKLQKAVRQLEQDNRILAEAVRGNY